MNDGDVEVLCGGFQISGGVKLILKIKRTFFSSSRLQVELYPAVRRLVCTVVAIPWWKGMESCNVFMFSSSLWIPMHSKICSHVSAGLWCGLTRSLGYENRIHITTQLWLGRWISRVRDRLWALTNYSRFLSGGRVVLDASSIFTLAKIYCWSDADMDFLIRGTFFCPMWDVWNPKTTRGYLAIYVVE